MRDMGNGGGKVEVVPDSLRATAKVLRAKAGEVAKRRERLVEQRSEIVFSPYHLGLNVTDFQDRFETATMEAGLFESALLELATELDDAAKDAETADATGVWNPDAYLRLPGASAVGSGPRKPGPEVDGAVDAWNPDAYLRLPGASAVGSGPRKPGPEESAYCDASPYLTELPGPELSPAEQALMTASGAASQLREDGGAGFSYRSAMRARNQAIVNESLKELGIDSDEKIPQWKADALAGELGVKLAGDSEKTKQELQVMVATTLADADLVEGGGQKWLADWSADLIDPMLFASPSEADQDLLVAVGGALSTRPEASAAFFDKLGVESTARLPELTEGGSQPGPTGDGPSDATVAFSSALAIATRQPGVGFTGAELMDQRPKRVTDESEDNVFGGYLFSDEAEVVAAVDPGYLFSTDEPFDPQFANSAATAEIRERGDDWLFHHKSGDDSPVVLTLEAVIANGPESTADFFDGLGDDAALLFRSRAPIVNYDHSDGEITSRVFDSLGRSQRYEDSINNLVISIAGASTSALDPGAAEATAGIVREAVFDPEWLAGADQQQLINAITATYRGGNRTLIQAETQTLTDAAETAWELEGSPLQGYLDAQGPRDTYEGGGLTADYLKQAGTRMGVLMLGRFEADKLDARSADEAAALNAHLFTFGVSTVGSLVPLPPVAAAAFSELNSETASQLWPAGAELRNAEGRLQEAAALSDLVTYLTAINLAEEGALVDWEGNSASVESLVSSERGEDWELDYQVRLSDGGEVGLDRWMLESNLYGIWHHWSKVELHATDKENAE